MKRNIKATLLVLALSLGLLATACADEPTPYEQYDKDNYTVSVRFDANGGYFDTGVSTITDSYNISDIAKNSSGMAEIPLLSPDDEARGTRAPENKGYFLAGWYTERIGNETEGYTYKNRWDFSKNTLQVDPQKSYSASQKGAGGIIAIVVCAMAALVGFVVYRNRKEAKEEANA